MSTNPSRPGEDNKAPAGRPIKVGDTFKTKRIGTPLDKLARQQAGKRSVTRTQRKRGRYIKARPAHDHPTDIAFDARSEEHTSEL